MARLLRIARFGRRGVRRWRGLVVETFTQWLEDRAQRLGAALAFYTVLSLAPVLVLVEPVASAVVGDEGRARRDIRDQFARLVGEQGAKAIDDVLASAAEQAGRPPNLAVRTISWVVLLFGAGGVFVELQEAMDTIWEVRPRPGAKAWWAIVRKRLFSFAMVLGTAFLLVVSLAANAALARLRAYAAGDAPAWAAAWTVGNEVAATAVTAALFALIYKVLPDATVRWRDVWVGAVLTAGLFTLGRYLIGEYLGRASVGDRYGATGSLVVILVWVYFAAQILYLGAEFTKAYARAHHAPIVPEAIAVPLTEEARAQQGIPHTELVEAVEKVVEKNEAG
ncbi:MAG TPA: YihY/virulence factor BrkB family protein [Humisphaera sp.]